MNVQQKKWISVIILVVLLQSVEGFAQNVRYAKTLDNPDETINHMFSIAPFELLFSGSKYASTSAMLSVNGVYGLNDRIGFEGYAGIPYFTVGGREGVKYVQAGTFFNFKTTEKSKEAKVILGYKRVQDVLTATETYKYLSVPAKFKSALGLRTGLQHNSSHVKTDGIKLAAASSPFTLTGLYGGFQSTSTHLIKTQLQDEEEPTPTGAIYKVFADALFYPLSKIKDPFLASQIKSGSFGARIGLVWVQNPYSKKHNSSRYNAFLGRMSLSAEMGARPIDGFYAKGGVFWGIIYK